jgi:hypothetical protein
MRISIAFLVLLASGFAVDKKAPSPDLIPLSVSSSKGLATPTIFYMGNAQCDDKGDIFFLSGSPQAQVVYKLMSDGSHKVYGLLGEDARNHYYKAFHADRDGKVSLLAIEEKGLRPVVFHFDEDATEPARTTLDAPPEMDSSGIFSFTQLKTGHILLQGFFGESASAKDRGHAYIAEFDASGKFLRTFKEKDGDKDKIEGGHWAGHTSPLEGDDGFIYVLLPDRVLALSQTGRVRKTIMLAPPAEGYVAFQMYLAGSRIAIGYYKPGPIGQVTKLDPLYALFDASSGRQLRAYKPVAELAKSLLVGFSDEGFIFYRSGSDGEVDLLTARAD